jgi:hypothetical protein
VRARSREIFRVDEHNAELIAAIVRNKIGRIAYRGTQKG